MKRNCNYARCGRSYEAIRPTSKFCSNNCRARHSQTKGSYVPVETRNVPIQTRSNSINQGANLDKKAPPVPEDGGELEDNDSTFNSSLVKVTKNELEAAGVLNTMEGQQALRIAQQMSGRETAGGMASLSKELSRVKAEAMRSAPPLMADPVDELALKRDAKRVG
jgi:hypothetical protein